MPFDRETEVPEALRLARQALSLAPDDAEVLTAAALAIGNIGGDLSAVGMLARATELNPNYARAWHIRGAGCFFLGDLEQTRQGIEFCKRALRLAPLDPYRFQVISSMAQGYAQLEQFEEAYAWAERAYETRQLPSTAQSVIIGAMLSGREQRARELVSDLLAANPTATIGQMTRGIAHWRSERDKQRVYSALRQAGVPE